MKVRDLLILLGLAALVGIVAVLSATARAVTEAVGDAYVGSVQAEVDAATLQTQAAAGVEVAAINAGKITALDVIDGAIGTVAGTVLAIFT